LSRGGRDGRLRADHCWGCGGGCPRGQRQGRGARGGGGGGASRTVAELERDLAQRDERTAAMESAAERSLAACDERIKALETAVVGIRDALGKIVAEMPIRENEIQVRADLGSRLN